MRLNMKSYVRTVLFLLAISLASACNEAGLGGAESNRPDSIPETALWVGGADGGVYLSIERNNNDKSGVYSGVIYHSSGDVDFKGKLVINSVQHPDFEYKDSASYSGWDGDTLYLHDGRELKIIK